jgi:hypothetical protein
MNIEKIEFAGWTDCYSLSTNELHVVALAEVGPRIIQFGPNAERNCFYVDPATAGQHGGDTWNVYGGHRLWHAPEALPRSYQPDNQPVEVAIDQEAGTLMMSQAIEEHTGILKQIELRLSEDEPGVTVTHRLTNDSLWPITLAPWALSVMAPGGAGIMPLVPRGTHEENLQPTSSLVLWAYVDMADPRYTWGREFIMLRQNPRADSPQKIGLTASGGWVAYALEDLLFVKTFEELPGAPYPDQGCTVELFTNPAMLEVETLAPLTTLNPGDVATHVEHWHLWSGISAIHNESDVREHILPLIRSI